MSKLKKLKNKKVLIGLASLLLIVILLIISNVTGCSNKIGRDASKLDLVPALSEKELMDYYASEISNDTVINRNIDVDVTSYETKEVTDANKLSKLNNAIKKIESSLSPMSYSYSSETSKLIDENTYGYIKSFLNDKKLTNGKVTNVSQALGYYFVDVDYTMSSRSIGSFKNKITLLGLNGAFVSNYDGTDTVDNTFMIKAVSNLNAYYKENKIAKSATYDSGSGLFSEVFNGNDSSSLDRSITSSIRYPKIDIDEFDLVVGSGIRQSAYMPAIDTVYNMPGAEGTISGIGAYPSGSYGLTNFDFNRDQIKGTVTLRYVLKDNILNSNEIDGVNIYPTFYKLETGIASSNTDEVLVPEFLKVEFEKLLERSDRAIINCDMNALMNGKIYTDCGMALLLGYEDKYTNLNRNISSMKRIIARDIEDNVYLVEVETVRQEGAKGADVYGTYKDTYYMTVQQEKDSFVITDKILMSRKMTTEPDITPDDAVIKRIAALNLAGDVTDNSKESVNSLLGSFYTACSYRVLNGGKEVETSSGKQVIDKGMYDCFNSDVSMLSSTKKEYINSSIREQLVRYGTNVKSSIKGTVTEWIGGADNQVEFTTEELITYKGKNTGIYMRVYYLVSSMNDEWVIDDLEVLESTEITGSELDAVKERLEK